MNTAISSATAEPPQPLAAPVSISLPGQGRVVRAFGDDVTFLLEGGQTGGRTTMWINKTPPGGGPPPHYHLNEDEWFVAIEGRVSFFGNGKWTEIPLGSVVFAARGSVHTFKNIGQTPSKLLITTAPSGFETFFTRCAEEFRRDGGPDMGRITAIAAEHGIHFVQ